MSNTVYLQKSDRDGKKYKVTIFTSKGKKIKTLHFGASGYSDYTKHKDPERLKKYNARHKSRENWTKSGITTAGFWAKWILWSKPSIKESVEYTSNKFNITIRRGSPPLTTKNK